MTKPIRILFLSANPRNITQLQLEKEAEAIRSRIESQQNNERLELIPYFAATKELLREALLKHRPHVLHFSGHGSPTTGILLEDSSGNIETVALDALADLISIVKDNLQLVVLNACYSALHADGISRVVEITVGMRHEIGDEAAIQFAAAFYEGNANGRSIKKSFELGRNALKLAGIAETHIPDLLEGLGVDANKVYLGRGADFPAGPPDQSPDPPRQDADGTMQIDVIVLQRGTNVKIESWRYATGVNQHYFITLDGSEKRLPPEEAWQSLALKINQLAARETAPTLPVDVFLFLRSQFVEIHLEKFEDMVRKARDYTWASNIYVVWNQTSQTTFESLYGDYATTLEKWFRILLKSSITDLIEITKKNHVKEDDEIALLRLLRNCALESVTRRERMTRLVSHDSWGMTLRDGAFFLEEFLKKFFTEEPAATKGKNLIVFYDQRPPKSWIQLVENSRVFDRSGNWFISLGRKYKSAVNDLRPLWSHEAGEVKPAYFDDIFIFGTFEWLYSVIRLRRAGIPSQDELLSSGQAEVEWVTAPNNALTPRDSHKEDLRLLITSIFVLQEEHFSSSGYAKVVEEQRIYFLEAAKEVGAVMRNLKFNVAVEVFHYTHIDQLAALVKKKEFTAWLFLGHRNAPREIREQFAEHYADPEDWLYGFQLFKASSTRLVFFSSFASTFIAKKLVASGVHVAVGFEDVTKASPCQEFSSVLIPIALAPGQTPDAILGAFSKASDELSAGDKDGNEVKPRVFAVKPGQS